jgi:hypothetical protein
MKTIFFLIVVIAIIILWSLWGYFSSRVEQAEYIVIKKMSGYEIREYPAHIVAQTTVKGKYEEALNEGFRIVAGYIFGNNSKKQSIAMTTPVTEQGTGSEKISMTAPVLETTQGELHIVSFGMPRSYTLQTLPEPTDSRVKIVQLPTKKFAAVRFSWLRTNDRIKKEEAKLLKLLSQDNVEVLGSPVYAGYNAPWTPPWMTRNEVMVEIIDKKI